MTSTSILDSRKTARRRPRVTGGRPPAPQASPDEDRPERPEPPLCVLSWDLEGADVWSAADWIADQGADLVLLQGLPTQHVARLHEALAMHLYTRAGEIDGVCSAVAVADDGPLVVGADPLPLAQPWPFATPVAVRLRAQGSGRERPLLRILSVDACSWSGPRRLDEALWLTALAQRESVLAAGNWHCAPIGQGTIVREITDPVLGCHRSYPVGKNTWFGDDRPDRVLTNGGLPDPACAPEARPPGPTTGHRSGDRPLERLHRLHLATALLPAVLGVITSDDPDLRKCAVHLPVTADLDVTRLNTGLREDAARRAARPPCS
ncbi:hypothetical protein [Kitasatospora sp. NPDC090091]|uniref:hypothetical protein n=1 Tax=Kitasatospora sp. NPDC090091 TaxID=3364081 RepID=UPI0037F5CD4B